MALNWALERVLDAANNVDAHLQAVGLKVHHNTNGICIRSRELSDGSAIDKLNEHREDKRGLDHSAARRLFAAFAGTLSSGDLSTDARLKVGSLVNRGAIVLGNGDGPRVQLSDDCAFAFAVE